MVRHWFSTAVLLLLGGCAAVPPGDMLSPSAALSPVSIALGDDQVGQACTLDSPVGAPGGRIFCAKWPRASARVARLNEQGPIEALAVSSRWRDSLDINMACGNPMAAQMLGQPAMKLRCRRTVDGLPQTALLVRINGQLWATRGTPASQAPAETAIGVLSGIVPPQMAAPQAGLTARRVSLIAIDPEEKPTNELYEQLRRAAGLANRGGDFAPAEAAYRRALYIGRKLKLPDVYLADDAAAVAVQLSAEGRAAQADAQLGRATVMLGRGQPDDIMNETPNLEAAKAALDYDTGLVRLNEGRYRDSANALADAERAYAGLLGDDAQPRATGTGITALSAAANQSALANDEQRSRFLAGLVDAKRHKAVALLKLGDRAGSVAAMAQSQALATANMSDGFSRTAVFANMLRTAAFIDEDQGDVRSAMSSLGESEKSFIFTNPLSPNLAETSLFLAAREARAGDAQVALMECRNAVRYVRDSGSPIDPDLMEPCLDVIWSQRGRLGAEQAATEMFEDAQLAQTARVSDVIATTAAQLKLDPKLGALITARETARRRQSELVLEAAAAEGDPLRQKQAEDMQAAAEKNLGAAEEALQSALPGWEQLVQRAVTTKQVFGALKPHEAFVATLLANPRGWSFILRDGEITAAPIEGGTPRIDGLVKRVRASLDSGADVPPPFDTEASFQLYDALFGQFPAQMAGASSLVVAPSGALLSVPFAILLTRPVAPGQLAQAAWLVQRVAIAHVPAPANFVSLRKQAGTSTAPYPFMGFGEFQPVTPAQAEASFPAARCGDSGRRLAGLAPLPRSRLVIETIAEKMRARPQDVLLGADFNVEAVQRARLADYRFLLFDTHASLPTDLACENEPALATSPPPGANDASGALLTASKVARLHLNADLVVLAACNTGGPAGDSGGETLSGLALGFFAAGARSLMVTHWTVNEATTEALVFDTATNAQATGFADLAAALANAQRMAIHNATGEQALYAHPYFWGQLALVGAGSAGNAALAGL